MARPSSRGATEPPAPEIAARLAITEVLYRYCRALDRMDRELALSCWVDGGTDEHLPQFRGSASAFLDWLWPVHARFIQTRHMMGNVLIDLRGDRAGVESYVSIVLRARRDEGLVDLFTQGRYLDDFERVDGRWAIRHRRSVSEWHRVERVRETVADYNDPPLVAAAPPAGPPLKAARDRSDPSYGVLDES